MHAYLDTFLSPFVHTLIRSYLHSGIHSSVHTCILAYTHSAMQVQSIPLGTSVASIQRRIKREQNFKRWLFAPPVYYGPTDLTPVLKHHVQPRYRGRGVDEARIFVRELPDREGRLLLQAAAGHEGQQTTEAPHNQCASCTAPTLIDRKTRCLARACTFCIRLPEWHSGCGQVLSKTSSPRQAPHPCAYAHVYCRGQ